jgi:hypothetical protein
MTDIEQRITDALAARANAVIDDATQASAWRPDEVVRVVRDPHPRRHRPSWLIPLLAAEAVVIAALATTAVVTTDHDGHPTQPATQLIPAPSTLAATSAPPAPSSPVDSPTVVAPAPATTPSEPDPAQAFVGEWQTHDGYLHISSTTAGSQTFDVGFGGCHGNGEQECVETDELTFAPSTHGTTLDATIVSSTYVLVDQSGATTQTTPETNDVGSHAGDRFALTFLDPYVLIQQPLSSAASPPPSNFYWCSRAGIPVQDQTRDYCGA